MPLTFLSTSHTSIMARACIVFLLLLFASMAFLAISEARNEPVIPATSVSRGQGPRPFKIASRPAKELAPRDREGRELVQQQRMRRTPTPPFWHAPPPPLIWPLEIQAHRGPAANPQEGTKSSRITTHLYETDHEVPKPAKELTSMDLAIRPPPPRRPPGIQAHRGPPVSRFQEGRESSMFTTHMYETDHVAPKPAKELASMDRRVYTRGPPPPHRPPPGIQAHGGPPVSRDEEGTRQSLIATTEYETDHVAPKPAKELASRDHLVKPPPPHRPLGIQAHEGPVYRDPEGKGQSSIATIEHETDHVAPKPVKGLP